MELPVEAYNSRTSPRNARLRRNAATAQTAVARRGSIGAHDWFRALARSVCSLVARWPLGTYRRMAGIRQPHRHCVLKLSRSTVGPPVLKKDTPRVGASPGLKFSRFSGHMAVLAYVQGPSSGCCRRQPMPVRPLRAQLHAVENECCTMETSLSGSGEGIGGLPRSPPR